MESLKLPKSPERLAFIHYLRTGEILPVHLFAPAPALETKFNPYHDPQNGQFTFAPGGGGRGGIDPFPSANGTVLDGVYHPGEDTALIQQPIQFWRPPPGLGGNISNFYDPMTLEQAFPGLSVAPGGAILADLGAAMGVVEPSGETMWTLAADARRRLIADIKKYDPNYRHDSFVPETIEGAKQELSDLRWDRAAIFYRATGNNALLQTETFRTLQDRVDAAYEKGLKVAAAGELPRALSERMAIGNYIDRTVKSQFRDILNVHNLTAPTGSAVRVSGREYDTSGNDLTYSIPDARVGSVAYDVTLWQKTLASRQIKRFFNSDFKPDVVVIIRPSQLGPNSSYAIKRPGN